MKVWNGNLKVRWIGSFLILLALLLCIFSGLIFWTSRRMTDEAVQANYNSSTFIKKVLDERLNAVQDRALQMLYDPETTSLLHETSGAVFTSTATYQFVNTLQGAVNADGFVGDIYFYYPQAGYIVGSRGVYPAYSYYLLSHGNRDNGYSSWLSMLHAARNRSFFLFQQTGGSELLYSRLISVSGHSCVMIASVGQPMMETVLRWANAQGDHAFTCITDASGKLYAYGGDRTLNSLLVKAQHGGAADQFYTEGSYFVVRRSSAFPGLSYYLVRKKSRVLQTQSAILHTLLAGLALCALVGVGLAVFLTNRNARPFIFLARKLKTSKEEDERDAYRLISHRIDEMFQEKRSTAAQLLRQQRLIEASYLRAALTAELPDERSANSLCAVYGVTFANPYFRVLVLAQETGRPENGEPPEEPWPAFCGAAENEGFSALYAFLPPYGVFLLNYESGPDGRDCAADAFEKRMAEYCARQGRPFRYERGGVYSRLSDVPLSFHDAVDLLEGHRKQADDSAREGSRVFYEFESTLMENRYADALNLLPELCLRYLDEAQPNTGCLRRCAVANQVAEACHRTPGLSLTDADLTELSRPPQPDEPLSGFRRRMTAVLTRLSRQPGKAARGEEPAAARVKSIIDTSYANPLLGLSSVSEQLGLSAPYVSHTFKKSYGIGVADYMNKVRIEKAKQLILTEKWSVKEIAIQVGFASDVNFIRVFKKFEKTTPGRYKQLGRLD